MHGDPQHTRREPTVSLGLRATGGTGLPGQWAVNLQHTLTSWGDCDWAGRRKATGSQAGQEGTGQMDIKDADRVQNADR